MQAAQVLSERHLAEGVGPSDFSGFKTQKWQEYLTLYRHLVSAISGLFSSLGLYGLCLLMSWVLTIAFHRNLDQSIEECDIRHTCRFPK